jgi:hypothetical protein
MGSRRSRPTYKVTMTGRPSSPEIEVKKHSQPIFSPIRLDAVSLLLKVRQASPKLNKESNPVNRILRALLKVVSSGKTRPSKGPGPDECRHSLRISQGDVRNASLPLPSSTNPHLQTDARSFTSHRRLIWERSTDFRRGIRLSHIRLGYPPD